MEYEMTEFNPGFNLKAGYKILTGPDTRNWNQSGCEPMEYVVLKNNRVVMRGTTCSCGRGCNGWDCIYDGWMYHDTDIEDLRAGE